MSECDSSDQVVSVVIVVGVNFFSFSTSSLKPILMELEKMPLQYNFK